MFAELASHVLVSMAIQACGVMIRPACISEGSLSILQVVTFGQRGCSYYKFKGGGGGGGWGWKGGISIPNAARVALNLLLSKDTIYIPARA